MAILAEESRSDEIRDRLLGHPNEFDISAHIWRTKYRGVGERSPEETFDRVARSLSQTETNSTEWENKYFAALSSYELLPGGRILASAGIPGSNLCSTFALSEVSDRNSAIQDLLRATVQITRAGGGIGCNFSRVRPRLKSKGWLGVVALMQSWDSVCAGLVGPLGRRAALMGMLDARHPDILDFISSKNQSGQLRSFNLSVLVPDELMKAVAEDAPWELAFEGNIVNVVRAKSLWNSIVYNCYLHAEPGLIFTDTMSKGNPLNYCERLVGTGSCGEQPLPAFGCSPCATINLARLVKDPFTPSAHLDYARFEELVFMGVRLLDSVLTISEYLLKSQKKEAFSKRRIALGLTGVASALIMCGIRYGQSESVAAARDWARFLAACSYIASAQLARERGRFPFFSSEHYIDYVYRKDFPPEVLYALSKNGLRNGVLNAFPPSASTSLLAGNVSSGIEPVFRFRTLRRISLGKKDCGRIEVVDYCERKYNSLLPGSTERPEYFVNHSSLSPSDHLAVQASVQEFIDGGISKTVNCPEGIPIEEFAELFGEAHRTRCKGITAFRPNQTTGVVLE